MVQRTTLADDDDRAPTPSPARPRPVDARRRQRRLDGCRGRRVAQAHGLVPGLAGRAAEAPNCSGSPRRRAASALRAPGVLPDAEEVDARTGYVTSGRTAVIASPVSPQRSRNSAPLISSGSRVAAATGSSLTQDHDRSSDSSTMRFPMKAAARARRYGCAADIVCGAAGPADDLEIRRERHDRPG